MSETTRIKRHQREREREREYACDERRVLLSHLQYQKSTVYTVYSVDNGVKSVVFVSHLVKRLKK